MSGRARSSKFGWQSMNANRWIEVNELYRSAFSIIFVFPSFLFRWLFSSHSMRSKLFLLWNLFWSFSTVTNFYINTTKTTTIILQTTSIRFRHFVSFIFASVLLLFFFGVYNCALCSISIPKNYFIRFADENSIEHQHKLFNIVATTKYYGLWHFGSDLFYKIHIRQMHSKRWSNSSVNFL